MARRVDPLPYQIKIVSPETGLPTEFFMRVWDAAFNTINETTGLFNVELIAGVGLSGGGVLGDLEDITFNLEDTAVTPGTYGDATNVPQIVVDQQGRITSATEVAITAPSATIAIEDNDTPVGNADTLNFEGDGVSSVTDEGGGKITVVIEGGGGGGGEGMLPMTNGADFDLMNDGNDQVLGVPMANRPHLRIDDYLMTGDTASKPALRTVPAGCAAFYYNSETSQLEVWQGSSWEVIT